MRRYLKNKASARKLFATQQGITLLEVMIGFVIFSVSLVAVLDYVGNQVYLQHKAQKNQQKNLLLYELAIQSELGPEHMAQLISGHPDLRVTVSDTLIDDSTRRNTEAAIFESRFSLSDVDSTLDWTVIEVR